MKHHVVAQEEDRRRQHERPPPVPRAPGTPASASIPSQSIVDGSRSCGAGASGVPVDPPPVLVPPRYQNARPAADTRWRRLRTGDSTNGVCGTTNGDRPAATASMLAREGGRRAGCCPWGWRSRPRWPRAGDSCARRACRTPGRPRRCRARCTPRPRCCRTSGAAWRRAAPPPPRTLRTLTGANAIALADGESLLAFDGLGDDHHAHGDPLAALVGEVRDDRVRVEPRLRCEPGCPLRSAIVAPLIVQDRRIGALVASTTAPAACAWRRRAWSARRPPWCRPWSS